jgi:hypothetical protein
MILVIHCRRFIMAKDRPYAIDIQADPDAPAEGEVEGRSDRIFDTGRATLDTARETGRAALATAVESGRAAIDQGRAAGRAALDRAPEVAGGARDIMVSAQDQIDELSDMGIVAAAGFAVGLSFGLMMAGVPRIFVVASAVPAALTMRSALARGIKPSRLVH